MAQQPIQIKGIVIDASSREPLIGVTVQTPHSGMATDQNGAFHVVAIAGEKITFTYVGYKPYEHKVKGNEKDLRVTMQEDAQALEDVVIEAGIIQRNKMGFTGAYNTVTAEELKSIGSTNILQSLKSLDPSFVQIENNATGSNPNVMGTFEVRGQTSMAITGLQDAAQSTSEANMPLFILDGFETSLQQINDMDINRVASITILKDAGSTAIYGSRGANGVVVIETMRPKAGKIFISYNGNYQLAAADLSVYNMMNASEKLEFERLAGLYGNMDIPSTGSIPQGQGNGKLPQQAYYKRLAMIAKGYDTYWLSEPIRTALTHTHSLTLSGGEGNLLFDATVNYNKQTGVMKGSDRDTYGGNLGLIYRGVENLNISNNINVQGTNAHSGAWGSFANFVNANPYYLKRNPDGSIPKYLGEELGEDVIRYNPLYDAQLDSRDDSDILSLSNNFALNWYVNQALRINASFSINYSQTRSASFIDPRNSMFESTTYDKKGQYTGSNYRNWGYNGNASVNYAQSFNKHNVVFIGRYEIRQTSNLIESYRALGFPEGAVGYPSYAFSYPPDAKPDYSESMARALSVLGAVNYNYDYRYLFDFNYNLDGSTRFGQNKRFQSFWSVGLGWNVQREPFAEDWDWLDNLKLRGTIGINGNQNMDVKSNYIYSYMVGNNMFGQSSYLSTPGNPNLRWQVVSKASVGVDLEIFKRFSLQLDFYKNRTDPQIVQLAQRPSTGVYTYPFNLGWLETRGAEFIASYRIFNKKDLFLSVRATGALIDSKYGGFEESLSELNAAFKNAVNGSDPLQSLQHYEDGRSPYDIWAVRSLGIDPSTGDEIFLTKDGAPTKIYNPDDRVVVASTRPDLQGVLGFNLRFKKLTLNGTFRYSLGAYVYNSALFNKVENMNSASIQNNQDRRALESRWKQPGDHTAFINIRSLDIKTPVSSRFIQKDNYLRGEAVKLMWNFTGEKWLNALALKDFSAGLTMQDIFNLNSTKIERGIDYPFQRSVMMNISARF